MNDEKEGEVAAAFSPDGRLMCFSAGFSALMIDETERPTVRGSILTHNHISDTAFSMHDIKAASELGLTELRVVGPSGWHSMKPGPGGVAVTRRNFSSLCNHRKSRPSLETGI